MNTTQKPTTGRNTKVSINLKLTESEIESIERVQDYHANLSFHDITATFIYDFFGILSDSPFQTIHTWRGQEREPTVNFQLNVSEKIADLYAYISDLIGTPIEDALENSLHEALGCSDSYIEEYEKKRNDFELEVVEEFGKDVIKYLREDKAKKFTNMYRNDLNVWNIDLNQL